MGEPEGVWAVLRDRLDYASFVPGLVRDMVRADLRNRDGTPYTVVKNPGADRGAGTYLRLEPADVELLELMDGRRSVQEILVEHLGRSGTFALDRLARLTAALRANGFFGEEPPPVYEKLRARRARRDPVLRAQGLLRRLVMWDIARWENAEGTVDLLYRLGGRFFFSSAGAAAAVVLGAAGLWVWVGQTASGKHDLVTFNGSYVLGILILVVLQVLSISVHEAGHALAIRHYGRRVRRLGVAVYYLFPCFYVDSTDMTLAPRGQRIVVSLAGPLAGLLVAAVCAFGAAAGGHTTAGDLAYRAASLFVFQFVLNLLPILDLDGYHILVDALDAPLLRQRALAFVRGAAIRKVRRRERWTRREIGLATFGGSAIATSLLVLLFSVWIWQTRVSIAAAELFGLGPAGAIILALIVLVFVGPLLVALLGRAVGVTRNAARLYAARRRRALEREMNERIATLARVRFLHGLPRQALAAIAHHLRVEEIAAGGTVVTYGEPGDRFYLVRSGRLEAIGPEGEGFGTIIPGEGFGELALLDRTTRSATVRALEPAVLWSLDRGHFGRWVQDRYEVRARIRASREERQGLAALPFFRGVSGQELDRIAARMRTRRVPAGEAVFHAGDGADRFYVIRQGQAAVHLPDGAFARNLGVGDSFGELALLFGGRRTATVRAVTDLLVAGLAREDFARLVRASGESAGDIRARTAHYVGAGLGGAVAAGT
ncbi:MAG: cyclic nucleotide-binding domain-containing protein [Chloroflexi bacterium]|nr:cyclic nucleotide-binding domain-containing protein [Chloroflexota bacterium]